MKKILLPGLVAGMAMLATGMVLSAMFAFVAPSLKSEYENTSVFRSMSDPAMMVYFIHPFVLGLVLALIWDRAKIIFAHDTGRDAVFKFAFAYWLISLSGMLISYATFQLSLIMVVSWTTGIFFESIVASFIFLKMNPVQK